MTSTALILAASFLQSGSSSLANNQVWAMLKEGAAQGGTVVCAPTGELAGVASLVATGTKVPASVLSMVGGDSSSASRFASNLLALNKSLLANASLGSVDSSIWVAGAPNRDAALDRATGLTPYYVGRADRLPSIQKWTDARLPMRARMEAPDVERTVVTVASFGTQLLPFDQQQFGSAKVPFVMAHATGYTEDETVQVASAPVGPNKKFTMVIAAPSGSTSMMDLIEKLNKNWGQAVGGLPARAITVQLPRVYQVVDRSLDDVFGIKPEDGLTVRERLTVCLGSLPIAANLTDRKAMPQGVKGRPPMLGFLTGPRIGDGTNQGKTWVLDRPFFFAVADSSSGQIVFAGICVTP